MGNPQFDLAELSKKELDAYLAMSEKEKKAFVQKWLKLKELQAAMSTKVIQVNNRTKEKKSREKEKKRKEETRRKIIHGGLLEAYLPDELKILDDDKNHNTALKEFLDYAFSTYYVKEKIKTMTYSTTNSESSDENIAAEAECYY